MLKGERERLPDVTVSCVVGQTEGRFKLLPAVMAPRLNWAQAVPLARGCLGHERTEHLQH